MEWCNIKVIIHHVSTTVNGIHIDNGSLYIRNNELFVSFDQYNYSILFHDIDSIFCFHYPGCALIFNWFSVSSKTRSSNYVFIIKEDITPLINALYDSVKIVDLNQPDIIPITVRIRTELQLLFVSSSFVVYPFLDSVYFISRTGNSVIFEKCYTNKKTTRWRITFINGSTRLVPYAHCLHPLHTKRIFSSLNWNFYEYEPNLESLDEVLFLAQQQGINFENSLEKGNTFGPKQKMSIITFLNNESNLID
ncbi:hypothetical protein EHI8A_008630 [Entamoeba histolytica HM-1:IMSS-B]|uniref:Uncharacterized protein n=6 Tax=Entamoeba histolytica TaxID=5759 RepID=C4M7J8_ENTH1|nr:hypothetical protein EHI_170360 [Entamoeba histolytica HM-1:IMSS]EMD48977.1 Hypothetical protein EHI5A_023880 [Entamoeba histolytica KU27]EMH77732.1 hypothetical protein EHI8A_008630 [Entamoeba histolytica HM-1:IMSS-B]EMS14552.1 hypothetical protein KM1_026580 [Entamoeba histolytica HM-3:IMSS]ENY64778.1 hypothetical protein EHI7A_011300 [Entamoeba histolytica HM-1:IMSS-A]GAT97511.1 hypothetical protein CL6EHI_170360 [Entamoeba histolytica]|eukprot:XP_651038.1 hypothetical protein EHI_170360 [Entamoeba histolytica HM-1:IMSS]